MKKWDWKLVGLGIAFVLAVIASFTAYNYRKEVVKETSARERAELSLNSQTETLLDYQQKLVWSESRVKEFEEMRKASQEGSKEETVGADGSRTTRETWRNTTEQLSRQIETFRVSLEAMTLERDHLRSMVEEVRFNEVMAEAKVKELELKVRNFRSWGGLAESDRAGLGYHFDLGFTDLGGYYINKSYTEFAPGWAINARF